MMSEGNKDQLTLSTIQKAGYVMLGHEHQREVDVLLRGVLGCEQSYLYAYPSRSVTQHQYRLFTALIERRQKGIPLAYLVGHQSFFSIELQVTPATLIPRPDTELLVEQVLLNLPADHPCVVADLGTGSGAIALSLARERPSWHMYATDICEKALQVAQDNAKALGCQVHFFQGDWCEALPSIQFDAIVCNPPYIAEQDEHLDALCYEPDLALVSGEKGLDALEQVIQEAYAYLKVGGFLCVEHGYDQADLVNSFFMRCGYHDMALLHDLNGQPRSVLGWKRI